ncbi:hypothetical protein LXL04_017652 [Taraxacum kok-saghyz]
MVIVFFSLGFLSLLIGIFLIRVISMEDLPIEVIVHILSRLPVKTIIHCKCVGKKWLSLHLLRSPAGFMIHHKPKNKTTIDYKPGILKWVELEDEPDHHHLHHDPVMSLDLNLSPIFQSAVIHPMGSVNGLICLLHVFNTNNYVICNPVTREYTNLHSKQYKEGCTTTCHGFGVGSLTGEYKVVRIFYKSTIPPNPISTFTTVVYTLGTGQWRSIGRVPFRLDGLYGQFLNDHAHWSVSQSDSSEEIYAFDFDNETFNFFPSPHVETIQENERHFKSLAVLKGCLCQSLYFDSEIRIWVMKEYGIKGSWHKELVIKQGISRDLDMLMYVPLRLIKFLRDGTILMVRYGDKLLAYSSQRGTIADTNLFDGRFTGMAYRPSFMKLRNFDSQRVHRLSLVFFNSQHPLIDAFFPPSPAVRPFSAAGFFLPVVFFFFRSVCSDLQILAVHGAHIKILSIFPSSSRSLKIEINQALILLSPYQIKALFLENYSRKILPVKTIIHCKGVCKKWLNLVSDSYFTNLHLSRSPSSIMMHNTPGILKWVEVEDVLDHHHLCHDPIMSLDLNLTPVFQKSVVSMECSVNGLIYLWPFGEGEDKSYICNPITREYMILSGQSNNYRKKTTNTYCFGVGSLTHEYKVLRIFETRDSTSSSPPILFEAEVKKFFGAFVNGHAHWIINDHEQLCAFDFDNETFKLFPSPPVEAIEGSRVHFKRLAILKGCLCQCDIFDSQFTIWVMKEYGIKKPWHREVIIKWRPNAVVFWKMWGQVYPIEYLNDGTILMFFRNKLLVYSPQIGRSGSFIVQAFSNFKTLSRRDFMCSKDPTKNNRYHFLITTILISECYFSRLNILF